MWYTGSMTRWLSYYFNILPFRSMKICPKVRNICNRRFPFFPNTKWLIKKTLLKIMPKWRNFANLVTLCAGVCAWWVTLGYLKKKVQTRGRWGSICRCNSPSFICEEMGNESEFFVDVRRVGRRRNVALGVVQLQVPREELGAEEFLNLKAVSNYEDVDDGHVVEKACTFFKKWANPGLFFHLLSVFPNKHHYKFYNKLMWKNFHPVYGAGIQTHNLRNMSLLP